MILTVLFCLLNVFLFASDDNGFQVQELSAHQAPNAIVHNCVNALTGKPFMIDEDGSVSAADTLSVKRMQSFTKVNWNVLGYNMRFFDPRFLEESNETVLMDTQRETVGKKYYLHKKNEKNVASIANASEKKCGYYLPFTDEKDFRKSTIKKNLVDDSGKSKIYKWVATHDDGTHWEFEFAGKKYKDNRGANIYLMSRKVLPNGNVIRYENDKANKRVKAVHLMDSTETMTLASVSMEYGKKKDNPRIHKLNFSNGQWVTYKVGTDSVGIIDYQTTRKVDLLYTVTYSDGRLIGYSYWENQSSESIGCPFRTRRLNGWNLFFKYLDFKGVRLAKIRSLYEYDGNEKKMLYKFEYRGDHTRVFDYKNYRTEYGRDPYERLKHVFKYDGKKLYKGHQYDWYDTSYLKSQWVGLPKKYALSHKYYKYDDNGNCIEETWTGNFTGNSHREFSVKKGRVINPPEQVVIKYSYTDDGRNLPTSRDYGNGYSEHYQYEPKRNLKVSSLKKVDGRIIDRRFTVYNSAATPIIEIHDDGSSLDKDNLTDASFRVVKETEVVDDPKMDGYSLPAQVNTYKVNPQSGEKTLVICQKYEYVNTDQLTREACYNSKGEFQFDKTWEYDERRLCIRTKDAIGKETHFEYDKGCYLIYKEVLGSGKKHFYTNDRHGRIIEERVVLENDEYTLKTTYNLKGDIASKADRYNNKTTYEYDCCDRLKCTKYHDGTQEIIEYDRLDAITKKVDRDNNITKYTNNAYGQPISIEYASGATEEFTYDKWGRVVERKEKNGTVTQYLLSPIGLILETQTYDQNGNFLRGQGFTYKGLKMISQRDYAGNETQLFYDEGGCKVKEVRNNRIETFEYNDLGQVVKHYDYLDENQALIKEREYDAAGRIVLEQVKNLQGQIIEKNENIYSRYHDQPLVVKTWTSDTTFSQIISEYNADELPTKTIDADGYVTTFRYYHENCLIQVETDGEGRKSITHIDDRGLKTLVEKRNKLNNTIALEEYFYTGEGRIKSALYHKYIDELESDIYEVSYTYTSFGPIDSITQRPNHAYPKFTEYIYNEYEQLVQVIENETNILNYVYDDLGRQIEIISNDGTVHFQNEYNIMDQMTYSLNVNSGLSFTKEYDKNMNLIKESWSNGAFIKMSHDVYQRVKNIYFHDGSSIAYEYKDKSIECIDRITSSGQVYSIKTNEIDWKGRALTQKLPFGLNISHEYSGYNRKLKTISPIWSQELIEFDQSGLLKQEVLSYDNSSYERTYDFNDNKQLIKEEGLVSHTYNHDSLDNRLAKDQYEYTVNEFNQVTFDGVNDIEYDVCGNRIKKGDVEYVYNALHRLSEVHTSELSLYYTYDVSGRRVTRELINNEESLFSNYLYFDLFDIGSYNENLEFYDFRILSPEHHPMAIVTAAIEVDGMPFGIIRDDRQNIVCLYDQNQNNMQYINYSAFGESEFPKELPWGFSDQRTEHSVGLILFNKRVLDPELGSWINPDPLYFKDGVNRYAFVHNNPLANFDPYGLLSISQRYSFISSLRDLSSKLKNKLGVDHERKANEILDRKIKKEKSMTGQEYDAYEPKHSASYHFKGTEDENFMFTFVNGIDNNEDEFEKNMNHLQGLNGGHELFGVHNQTYGLNEDLKECLIAFLFNKHTNPAKELALLWVDLLEANPEKNIIHVCHSQGGIHTKYGLKLLQKEHRERISVLSVNPAMYPNKKYCKSQKAVIGKGIWGDPVSKIDIVGLTNPDSRIESVPVKKPFSHGFRLPVYINPIKEAITDLKN